jgi:hypothetical protein
MAKYFVGVAMLLLNLGSRYLVIDLSETQEQLLQNAIVRRFTMFSLFYVATRDLYVALTLTAVFVVLTLGLWNKKAEKKTDK